MQDCQKFLVQQPFSNSLRYNNFNGKIPVRGCCFMKISDFYFKMETKKPYFTENEKIVIIMSRITGAKCQRIDSVNGILKRKITIKTTGGKCKTVEEVLYDKMITVSQNYLKKREKLRKIKKKKKLTKSEVKEKKNEFCKFKFKIPHNKHINLPSCEGLLIRCQYFFECDIYLKGIFNKARNFETSVMEILISQNPKSISSRRIKLQLPNKNNLVENEYHTKVSDVLVNHRFSRKSTPNKKNKKENLSLSNMFKSIMRKKERRESRLDSINSKDSFEQGLMFASFIYKKNEKKNDSSFISEKPLLTEIEEAWTVLPELNLVIDENPKYQNKAISEELKKKRKRELLAKQTFLRKNECDFKKFYKRESRIDKKILEVRQEKNEIFRFLEKKEKIVDGKFQGIEIIYSPYETEYLENKAGIYDPKNISNENFQDNCFTFTTPKENYEDVKLEEVNVAKGLSKLLSKKGINLKEKVHHSLDAKNLDLLRFALLKSNRSIISEMKSEKKSENNEINLSNIKSQEQSKVNSNFGKELIDMIQPGERVKTTERDLIDDIENDSEN